MLDAYRLDDQPWQRQWAVARIEEVEKDLEDRVAAAVPWDVQLLDELLERHVLVDVRLHGHLPNASEQIAKRGVPAKIQAQGHGVHEESDQRLGLAAAAAGDRRPDGDVVLAAAAGRARPRTRTASS